MMVKLIVLGLMLATVPVGAEDVATLDGSRELTQEKWGWGGINTYGSFHLVLPSFKELGASASLQSGGCPVPEGYKLYQKFPLHPAAGCTGDAGCTYNSTQVDAATGKEIYRCTIIADAHVFSCDADDGCGCAQGMCRVCYDMKLEMNEHMTVDQQKHCRFTYLEQQKQSMQMGMVGYSTCSHEKIVTNECGIFEPATAAPTEAPTPPGRRRKKKSQGGCQSISAAVSDAWCTTNCNHVPPNCPQTLCQC